MTYLTKSLPYVKSFLMILHFFKKVIDTRNSENSFNSDLKY